MSSSPSVGVLALQGDFAEHRQALEILGVEAVEVRLPKHLAALDALIIPGGESTTIGKLAVGYDLMEPLRVFGAAHPIWGTCAGAILLAKEVEGQAAYLKLMDISVRRNAFGRQIDSFIANLEIQGTSYPAVFIRAPLILSVGPDIEVLARLDDGRIVAAQQGHLLVTSFHPELTRDVSFHERFLRMIMP